MSSSNVLGVARSFGAFVSNTASASDRGGVVDESIFCNNNLPDITIPDYANRIGRFMRVSGEPFLLATAYLMRLLKDPSDVGPSSRSSTLHGSEEGEVETQGPRRVSVSASTAHRYMIASVTVAAKFIDENTMTNDYYAVVGGVKLRELNRLELEILQLLKWNAFVGPQEYQLARQALFAANPSWLRRGFYWQMATTSIYSHFMTNHGVASNTTGHGLAASKSHAIEAGSGQTWSRNGSSGVLGAFKALLAALGAIDEEEKRVASP